MRKSKQDSPVAVTNLKGVELKKPIKWGRTRCRPFAHVDLSVIDESLCVFLGGCKQIAFECDDISDVTTEEDPYVVLDETTQDITRKIADSSARIRRTRESLNRLSRFRGSDCNKTEKLNQSHILHTAMKYTKNFPEMDHLSM